MSVHLSFGRTSVTRTSAKKSRTVSSTWTRYVTARRGDRLAIVEPGGRERLDLGPGSLAEVDGRPAIARVLWDDQLVLLEHDVAHAAAGIRPAPLAAGKRKERAAVVPVRRPGEDHAPPGRDGAARDSSRLESRRASAGPRAAAARVGFDGAGGAVSGAAAFAALLSPAGGKVRRRIPAESGRRPPSRSLR